MTLDQLRYFLETARLQHLGQAAISLNISASAVSAAITALEDEFQCKLFDRDGKRIYLSENGKLLRMHAEKLFDQTASLKAELLGKNIDLGGTYKLGASHYLATHILAPIWQGVQKKYPNLSIELGSAATHRVVSEILAGTLDGGLCISPLRHPDLKEFEVYEGQMRIAVRKNHPILKMPVSQQVKSLSLYPAILHKPVVGVDLCEDHPMFEKYSIKPNIRCYWDSDEVAVQILKGSDTWAMLPDFVFSKEKSLLPLETFPGWNAPIYIKFLVRKHRGENPVVHLLFNEIKLGLSQIEFR